MKLSRMKPVLASFFLLALAGCESPEMPHVFGSNEVPQSVLDEPRAVVSVPSGTAQDQPWMRLGDVPSKPQDFTRQAEIDQSKQQMVNDRAAAQQLKQAADNPAPAAQP